VTTPSQAVNLSQEVKQMHMELGSLQGQLAAAHAQLEHTQGYDSVAAYNNQLRVRGAARGMGLGLRRMFCFGPRHLLSRQLQEEVSRLQQVIDLYEKKQAAATEKVCISSRVLSTVRLSQRFFFTMMILDVLRIMSFQTIKPNPKRPTSLRH
jgi:hypothetical protein